MNKSISDSYLSPKAKRYWKYDAMSQTCGLMFR